MIKKIVSFTLVSVIAFTSVFTAMSYELDKSKDLTVEDVAKIAIEESTEAQNIELNTSLLKISNEKKIKDYTDYKEKTMAKYEGDMKLRWGDLEIALRNMSSDSAMSIVQGKTQAYYYAKNIYKSSVEGYVSQVKSLEPTILKIQQSEKQQKAEMEKLKVSIKKECYDLYINIKELELAKADIVITINQLNAENIKKSNGMSTDIQIKELEKQREQAEMSITDLENSIALKQESLKTKLNITTDENLQINFKLPEANVRNYTLKSVLEQFAKESLDYETIKNSENISRRVFDLYTLAYTPNLEVESWAEAQTEEERNNLLAAEIEIKLATNNVKTTKQNMDLYVKNAYFQYNKSAKNLSTSLGNKALYQQKDLIADANLAQGVISKIQYDTEKQDLRKKMFEGEKALITYENAKNQLDLVLQGIWVKQ